MMNVEKKTIDFGDYSFDVYRLEDGSYWLSLNQVKAKINKFDNMLEGLVYYMNEQILDIKMGDDIVQVISFPVAVKYWTHYCIVEKDESAKNLLKNIQKTGMFS